jgi:hypothetical protein
LKCPAIFALYFSAFGHQKTQQYTGQHPIKNDDAMGKKPAKSTKLDRPRLLKKRPTEKRQPKILSTSLQKETLCGVLYMGVGGPILPEILDPPLENWDELGSIGTGFKTFM